MAYTQPAPTRTRLAEDSRAIPATHPPVPHGSASTAERLRQAFGGMSLTRSLVDVAHGVRDVLSQQHTFW